MGIGNTGIPSTYKVPRYIAKIVLAAGIVSAGSQTLRCLCVGMKTSAGSIVADAAPIGPVTSVDDVDTFAGAGSQLAMEAYQALTVPAVELWLQAVSEPSGSKATATIVLGGTNTVGGTIYLRIAGQTVIVNVGPTDTLTTIGTNAAAAINNKVRLPVTAAYNSGTSTLTIMVKNFGTQGKDWILYWDNTNAPPGLTLTLAGSATVNVNGVRFGASASGTGSEDVTTALTRLATQRYARIAAAQNDATNAGLWDTQLNTNAGPLALLLDQVCFGYNNTLSGATTLAQTTLNAFRAQVLWLRNGENHPCEIAAIVAAYRSVTEQDSPVPDYDGFLLASLTGQAFDADVPDDAELQSALNAGVTPLQTVNGDVSIVRAITTYCLNGSDEDDRCLDIGDIVFTDFATLDLRDLYETEFRPQNPLVGPDPAPDEQPPPAGVAYPQLWNSAVSGRLQAYYNNGWTEFAPTVAGWAPVSTFNDAGKYIATDTPLPVRRVQHRLDNVMRQISA